ncbi:citramalate synthase [Dehalococcoides mccartyi]|uniref:citramalate synthase n=1 Tax=Dehalococcoides mccartyi TaxID=61435 RepID=UPI002AFEEEF9|nr:citramalate synthase [Dehalococcoides mccartyi]MEA2122118.1 (R)-citramalate synthase [Dehalococcoides mccartyi]
MQVKLYDTTLRDGSQREGISFTVADKLKIAQKLDELGIHYIEGGWPGSNPKDSEFFVQVKSLKLKNAKMVAFGSTRRPKVKAEADATLKQLFEAGTEYVTLVGKSSARQVTQVLETTLEENLAMITDSIEYLRSKCIKVFLDAEHFFDGYKDNPEYSIQVLQAAEKAGAEGVVLCDTNGGSLPEEIAEAVEAVTKSVNICVGIHSHNDTEMAVANSIAALKAGASQIQGTINGFGERCGNANMCSIIPILKLKMGIDCITDSQLKLLTDTSHYISELANLVSEPFLPYVGASAFSHKAGLHVSGLSKWSGSYQHIEPELVGNRQRLLVSELAGRSNSVQRAKAIGINLTPDSKEVKDLLQQVKKMESMGFQYENAEASFDLLVNRTQAGYAAPFELIDFMVVVEKQRRPSAMRSQDEMMAEGIVKVRVDGEVMHTVAEGNGPINALDAALRKGLCQFYPELSSVHLSDYKVRILEQTSGTDALVRVLIESTDGESTWHTVGASPNIIEASWLALSDSFEYWLITKKCKNCKKQ